jgi:hypothetical protein
VRCLHTLFEWHRLSGDRDTRRKWSGFPAPTEYPWSETKQLQRNKNQVAGTLLVFMFIRAQLPWA